MITTMAVIGHMTLASFKPMNIFKVFSTQQTISTPVKLNRTTIELAFRRSA